LAIADTTQLARAIGNLLQNAVEANADQITVTIEPACEKGYVSVIIADDGQGIPPEMLDEIWASFITTKGNRHVGLGLPACLHVITQLDGRMTVDSQPGVGTAFIILLPASAEPRDADGPTRLADFLSQVPKNILLIDDDDDWAKFVTESLTAAGQKVTRRTTVNGVATANLILVDEALMATPIADVLAMLKSSGAGDKAILASAAMNVERTTAYLQAGVKDVVLKPYTADELAAILAQSPPR